MRAASVLVVASAFVAVASSETAGAAPAGHVRQPASFPGTYTEYDGSGAYGALTIAAADTFTADYPSDPPGALVDSGSWSASGKAIVLTVTRSSMGDAGCVFHGTATKGGINSLKRRGPYSCPQTGYQSRWYAVRQ
ncbi:MAG: hypothetical protein ACLQPH_07885 [Acidimicrobiales bacterium]